MTARQLSFQDLSDVMPDVERLLAGHSLHGQWSLAQICNHLATTIKLTARPVAEQATPSPEQAAIQQAFFGAGRFPAGRASPAPFVPKDDLDTQSEAAALGDAIKRFNAAAGPFPAHPMLGPLTREQWLRFHTMHAQHHLEFAVPA